MKSLPKTDTRQVEWERTVAGIPRPLVMVCPECGRKMVRRSAKKSAEANSQFWGCSGFPECRVLLPIKQ
ncbi:topoisomerase DNA-binding C4 zinc finger domain-containing protein [Pseudomonadota bacterium]